MQNTSGVRKLFIKLHSVVDLITNSSTELFIVDASKAEGVLKEMLEFIIKGGNSGYSDTKIETLENYRYKEDFIIPEDLDQSQIYIMEIDHNDTFLERFVEKYFTTISLKYKND